MGFLWGSKTKKCCKCKMEIDADAKKCPYCLSKQTNNGTVYLLFLIFGVLYIIGTLIPDEQKQSESSPATLSSEQTESINDSKVSINNDNYMISNTEPEDKALDEDTAKGDSSQDALIEDEVDEESADSLSKKDLRKQRRDNRKAERQAKRENKENN